MPVRTLQVRRDAEIHREDGGWFQARWHFSFDSYRDPEQMGVGPLRVFNHDRLEPGAVWPMHPHADVEGITYVWKGLFRHADSLGNNGLLRPGAVQLMSLGSGALHSEQNGSTTEPMEFLQLWILPDTPSLRPSLQQRQFSKEDRTDRLLKVIGPEGGDVITVHQNASVYVAALGDGVEAGHAFGPGRGGYLYLIDGELSLPGSTLHSGDAVKIFEEPELQLRSRGASELLLVDVPLRFTPVGVWAR
ncbi:MAG TPA: pirin family protein [Candidatus Dormibacteraeota bacterium]|nr:pirin family protein [Candidatus Dormibacteraeota bacterium]